MLGLGSAQRGDSLYPTELRLLEAKRLFWGLTVNFKVLSKLDERRRGGRGWLGGSQKSFLRGPA